MADNAEIDGVACECVGYTIRTDCGTRVEYDIDPSSCPAHGGTPEVGRRWWQRKPRHKHAYERVGYGGAGWSLLRCPCGATEIDA